MRAVDCGYTDQRKNRLKKKNRLKIRSADPEPIARIRKFKLLILAQLRVLYPPRSADFFFSSYVQGQRYSPS